MLNTRYLIPAIKPLYHDNNQSDEKYVYEKLDKACAEVKNFKLEEKDEENRTPLMWAVLSNSLPAVNWVLDKSKHPSLVVKFDATDKRDALRLAIGKNYQGYNHQGIIPRLIGGKITMANVDQILPEFQWAINQHNFSAVEAFCQNIEKSCESQVLAKLVAAGGEECTGYMVIRGHALHKLMDRYTGTVSSNDDVSDVVNGLVQNNLLKEAAKMKAGRKLMKPDYIISAFNLLLAKRIDLQTLKDFLKGDLENESKFAPAIQAKAIEIDDEEIILTVMNQNNENQRRNYSDFKALPWKSFRTFSRVMLSFKFSNETICYELLKDTLTRFLKKEIDKKTAIEILISILRNKLPVKKEHLDIIICMDDLTILQVLLDEKYISQKDVDDYIGNIRSDRKLWAEAWKFPQFSDQLIAIARRFKDSSPLEHVLQHFINKKLTFEDAQKIISSWNEWGMVQDKHMQQAAESGDTRMIDFLLSLRGKLNGRSNSPALIKAAELGNVAMVHFLLVRGAICEEKAISAAKDKPLRNFLKAVLAAQNNNTDNLRKYTDRMNEKERTQLVLVMGEKTTQALENILGKDFVQKAKQQKVEEVKAEEVRAVASINQTKAEPSAPDMKVVPLTPSPITSSVTMTQPVEEEAAADTCSTELPCSPSVPVFHLDDQQESSPPTSPKGSSTPKLLVLLAATSAEPQNASGKQPASPAAAQKVEPLIPAAAIKNVESVLDSKDNPPVESIRGANKQPVLTNTVDTHEDEQPGNDAKFAPTPGVASQNGLFGIQKVCYFAGMLKKTSQHDAFWAGREKERSDMQAMLLSCIITEAERTRSSLEPPKR